ncbi:hypothetical protein PCANC_27924 [Puccinia coronata f. sp. avenae]|uniref:Uncharacterized protein n=1 Tax=Puccinia coronata f. sp. avenae TaxID=200324 RepID=A0A2N5TNK8_9BASI|nr:hypothetical protein PCANC_27924 [Puccinia coronata f. sp. avenae]PLW27044.1 hypothetical protein PCASD_26185 [Puccinia coronata f. sp. avenae]
MESADPRPEYFPLIAKIDNKARLRQYRVLVGLYQQVKDFVDQSGSGSLLTALLEFGLAQLLYEILLEMNACNPAANATGQDELSDTYDSLVVAPGASNSESNDGAGDDVPDDSQASGGLQQPTPIATPHRSRRCCRSLELTATERSLNEDTPPASPDNDDDLALPPVLDFGNSYPSPSLATPGSGTKPLATPGSGTNPTSALATGVSLCDTKG